MMRIVSVVLLKNMRPCRRFNHLHIQLGLCKKKTLAIRGRLIQVQLQKSELH